MEYYKLYNHVQLTSILGQVLDVSSSQLTSVTLPAGTSILAIIGVTIHFKDLQMNAQLLYAGANLTRFQNVG